MITKISIIIEKNELGYLAYCPEIEGSQAQGNSFDAVVNDIKEIVKPHLSKNEDTGDNSSQSDGIQSLLELVEKITADMTPEEIAQLPTDGAEQHDHYIYGIPKRINEQ